MWPMGQGVSHFRLPYLSLLPLCIIPTTSQPSDLLVMCSLFCPLFHLPYPICPLGSSVKPYSFSRADIVPALTRHPFINPVCYKNWTRTWPYSLKDAFSPKVECKRELGMEGKLDSLDHSLVSSDYWVFAEWMIIDVNWENPEVGGFLWFLFMVLLPVLEWHEGQR